MIIMIDNNVALRESPSKKHKFIIIQKNHAIKKKTLQSMMFYHIIYEYFYAVHVCSDIFYLTHRVDAAVPLQVEGENARWKKRNRRYYNVSSFYETVT